MARGRGLRATRTATTTVVATTTGQASGSDETRLLLLLQAAAFMTLFRENMRGRGAFPDGQIEQLGAGQADSRPGVAAGPGGSLSHLEEIFAAIEAEWAIFNDGIDDLGIWPQTNKYWDGTQWVLSSLAPST